MAEAVYEYIGLSTRDGFNRSLRHFLAVNDVVPEFESKTNLADELNALLDEKAIQANQIGPIVNALLVGHPKYNYRSRSYNLTRNIEEFDGIVSEVGKWDGVDMVLAYYHPDLGLTLINPKNRQHWESVQSLRRNELLTIYAGTLTDKAPEKLLDTAIDSLTTLLETGKLRAPSSLTQGRFKWKAPKPPAAPKPRVKKKPGRPPARAKAKAAPSAGAAPAAPPAAAAPAEAPSKKRRMTPMYSIPVSNELFHNGNVEAWKKVIQSYNAKYPTLEVFIFYEGERIHDINTLFKWGKVKHGSTIMIAVAGEDIKDLAKLQRYLRQGASPAFEAFLRFPVNTVLNLF
jgi:cell division septation protein DedD